MVPPAVEPVSGEMLENRATSVPTVSALIDLDGTGIAAATRPMIRISDPSRFHASGPSRETSILKSDQTMA